MVREKEERKSWALAVTGERREIDGFSGIMGWRQATLGWADDPVLIQGGRRCMGRWDIV